MLSHIGEFAYTEFLRNLTASRGIQNSVMQTLRRFQAILILLIVFPLTGCLFRSRRVERQVSTAPLKSATQAELIDYVNSQAAKIKTLAVDG